MDRQRESLRYGVMILYKSLGGKQSYNEIWPLFTDVKPSNDKKVMDKEMFNNILKAHNLNV